MASKRPNLESGDSSFLNSVETESEREKSELKPHELRAIELTKDMHVFEYGKLEQDHPVSQYVKRLFARLPNKQGQIKEILICPDWHEPNASAMPDGTIMISSGLIKEAETEEALIGVLAHEKVHNEREHHQKQRNGLTLDSIKAGLRQISIARAHEYEADLRGALVDMEEANLNPLGYKIFLEKLYKLDTGGYGITHGSSMDRALNISSAVHMVDLRSIAQDLHPIETPITDQLTEMKFQYSRRAIIRRPASAETTPERIQQARDKRAAMVEQIPAQEIPLAMQFVKTYLDLHKKNKDEDPDDSAAFHKLIKRFDETLIPERFQNTDRKIVKLFALSLFCKLPPNEQKYYLSDDYLDIQTIVESQESLKHTEEVLADYLSTVELNYSSTGPGIIYEIIKNVNAQKVFKNTDEWDLNGIKEFADRYTALILSIQEKYSPAKPETEESIREIIASQFINIAHTEVKPELAEALGIQTNLKEKLQSPHYKDGLDLGATKGCKEFAEKSKKIAENFANEMQNKNIAELGPTLMEIRDGAEYRQAMTFTTNDAKDKNEIVKIVFQTTLHSIRIQVFKIFRHTLNHIEPFKSLPKQDLDIIFWGVAKRMDIDRDLSAYNGTIASEEANLVRRARLEETMEKADPTADFTREERLYMEDEIEFGRKILNRNKILELSIANGRDKLKTIYDYLANPTYLRDTFGLAHINPTTGEDNYETSNLYEREKVFVSYFTSWFSHQNMDNSINLCDEIEKEGIPIYDLLAKFPELCGPMVSNLVYLINNKGLEKFSLEKLLTVSRWIADPILRNSFQRYSKDLHWDNLNFEQKLSLVFPDHDKFSVDDPRVQEEFIETEIRSKEHYDVVKKRIAEKIDNLTSEGNEQAGIAVLMSSINFKYIDVTKFISALLNSSQNDRELKRIIYDGLTKNLSPLDFDDSKSIEVADKIKSANSLLRSLYTLDNYGRQILLRSLLTSENGALSNKEKRPKFLRFLFKEWVVENESQKDIKDVLSKVCEELETIEEWELLYFALQNALRDKIAVPPDNRRSIPWSDMYEPEADLEGAGVNPAKIKKVFSELEKSNIPLAVEKRPFKYPERYVNVSMDRLRESLGRKKYLRSSLEQQEFTPVEFVKEVISKTGAPGVRFLQVMPQFVPISQEYERQFSAIYDSVKGQSKMAALSVLEREWKDMWDVIAEVEDRIGGGSAVTVYKAKTREGEVKVLKVRNPNIEYHLSETYRFASLVLGGLAKKHGTNYEAAQSALNDIKEWISADINFQGFLEKDQAFYNRHNGSSKTGYDYKIKIPKSESPENPYFTIEEFVEGKNLTEWDALVKEGHDMKQVTSLLFKNYIDQIMSGRAHSDVHIGNFRVTPNKEVAILDRNYFLEITDQEKELISSMVNPFASAESRKKNLLSYFKISDESPKAESLKQEVDRLVELTMNKKWNSARGSIIKLKQEGVEVPLNLTLLLKNINSLRMMLSKAGFKSFFEAYLYQPEKQAQN